LLEPAHPRISLARPWALLGVSQSSFYSRPRGERAEPLPLRRFLDEQYTRTPFDGVRRMTARLRQQGDAVHPKRVARLMQTLGLETIAPKPRTPQPPPEYRGDPSVLRGLLMRRANHVWSTDITSIRWPAGLIYLVAMMDWFRRYGLSWAVSMTLDGGVCLEALEQALEVAPRTA
jgi:putative transposase